MRVVAEVDPRYVSYNIEMVEVTGGRFWAPYRATRQRQNTPGTHWSPNNLANNADLSRILGPNLFEYRPPIDLSNLKLRKLAAALGPAYVRVSGTWRNSTYFQDNDDPPLKTPPPGFNGVLTRAQWRGVIDFIRTVHGSLVTSVATSMGTRDAMGVWTPAQAKAWFDYTKRIGGHIYATEFMNEPTLVAFGGGAPKGYDATAFGRDAKIFAQFLRRESPQTLYLGPGSAGEDFFGLPSGAQIPIIPSDALLQATGPIFDAFSYHFYPAPSHRCVGANGTDPREILTPAWFDRNRKAYAFYAHLRDRYLPGKELWLTETGEASCGGDTWAAQFVDSFRLLDQFGSLAQKGVRTIMYNTLTGSDYGLLDEHTFEPRPNYWAALLWKRTMGKRVLDPGIVTTGQVRVYAHCMNGANGGVTLLVLNIDRNREASFTMPIASERYMLSAPSPFSKTVLLNGKELKVGIDGGLPAMRGQPTKAGLMKFPPLTITFITIPSAGNQGCGP